jgi:eukaryotic-like serine/threonine-protein kinase
VTDGAPVAPSVSARMRLALRRGHTRLVTQVKVLDDEVQSGESDPAYELSARGKTMLQERLSTYALLCLLIATGYFPAFLLIWRDHPGVTRSALLAHIFSPWTAALLLLHAALWLVTRGSPLPRRWLVHLDVGYHVAVGVVFGRIVLGHPGTVIAPIEGLLALASVLGVRALLVPSSWRRTALVGVLLSAGTGFTMAANPAHFSAEWLGLRTTGPLFVNWAVVAVVLTSVASHVLYGLRREVRDARRLGQYTILERLGKGGMGVVYRAQHALLRRPTAVKLLQQSRRGDSIQRFEREVQLMAELTHPNTVAVYDYGRTGDGVFYYAMEYLEGTDLEGLVAVGGPQPPARVVHLLRQICGSLDEAHGRGLIHRDIKPANLFLCSGRSEPDTVKVLDFGLVKESARAELQLTADNAMLGTPLYMSPEAFLSPETIDARSDLYSLGAVAYLLLTGSAVFSGSSAIEVCAKHVHTEPDSPSARLGREVPPDLEALVLSCLAKTPERRPESALALRTALDACRLEETWGASEAAAWWQAHSARVGERHRAQRQSAPSAGQTVAIDLARAPQATSSGRS